MKTLVTGSSGHLGEALVRTLRASGNDVVGVDLLPSSFTHHIGSISDRSLVNRCMLGVKRVIHTATLHKPHVATHSRQEFIDTNVTGTLNLLEEASCQGVESFVFTSTTSVFGDALIPEDGGPAVWVTEDLVPSPKNIYGATKLAAEDLCYLFNRNHKLACLVLRTSRFFPEEDDDRKARDSYSSDNLKANEYLHRRVEVEDIVNAHMLALAKAPSIGFRKYIISATTPFTQEDLMDLRVDAPSIVRQKVASYESEYKRRNWKMFPSIDRVYVNDRARSELKWQPLYDFSFLVNRLAKGHGIKSDLANEIGSKGYHAQKFSEGPYPVT